MLVRRKVVGAFSQHIPVQVEIQIPKKKSIPWPRWKFHKADCAAFSSSLKVDIRFIPPSTKNDNGFTRLVLFTAKAYILRELRKMCIPGWSQECEI